MQDGYNHYIRIDDEERIIKGFSTAFEQPQEYDILVSQNAGRHFNPELLNDRGQYRLKWEDGEIVERSGQELEDEWNARPPRPPTDAERITELEAEVAQALLMIATGGTPNV